MLRADADADLEGALADWRQFRRRKRVADIHWIDALYQAYLTGIISLVVVAVASSMVGDAAVARADVDRLILDAPAWLGGLASFAVALGLRSGTRGGPLALERAEVRHVLLAPVDRTAALRGPALRQLRFLAFVAVLAGGIAGDLAAKRLPGEGLAWIAVGSIGALTLVGLGMGAALLASGLRLPRWLGSLLGLGLVGTSLAHGTGVLPWSPAVAFGELLVWPLQFRTLGVVVPVAALGAVAAGLALVGRTSLEAAERRSSLVGQLRFAATLQDLRTVIVLRRQLAMELPRLRPWLHAPALLRRWPTFLRGLHGLLRWPAARIARLVLLAVVAGLSLRGVWSGTTPLVVLAGLAMFVAGLDAVESLAQDVDHPTRRDASPLAAATIHLRHVPVGVLTMVLTAALAAAVASVHGGGQVPGDAAALLVVSMALGGIGGALVSVLSGPVSMSETWLLAPPEAQGMRLAIRTAWPPAIAVLGATPVLLARDAVAGGQPALAGSEPGVVGVAVLFAVVCGWVRVRDDVASWWKAQMAAAKRPISDRSPDG